MAHIIEDNEGPHFIPQLAHPADSALDSVCFGQAGEAEGVPASPGGWIPLKPERVLPVKMQPYRFS